MRISVETPNNLVDVSNGKFLGKTDLGDGYVRWDWLVQYPINNYNVSLNIGNYVHFGDRLGELCERRRRRLRDGAADASARPLSFDPSPI